MSALQTPVRTLLYRPAEPQTFALSCCLDHSSIVPACLVKFVHTQDDVEDEEGKTKEPVTPTCSTIVSKDDTPVLVIETAPSSYVYGNILILTSILAESQKTLNYLQSIFPSGFACIVTHDVVQTNVDTDKGPMKLVRRTGVASDASSAENLATIFELEVDGAPMFYNPEGSARHGVWDNVVARCVLGYRDASAWPSVGPTVQSIAVRRDYQGRGLVLDLFNEVERWFAECWSLNTVYWKRILKATQLKDCVVDRIPEDKDMTTDQHQALTDKVFFYEVRDYTLPVLRHDGCAFRALLIVFAESMKRLVCVWTDLLLANAHSYVCLQFLFSPLIYFLFVSYLLLSPPPPSLYEYWCSVWCFPVGPSVPPVAPSHD